MGQGVWPHQAPFDDGMSSNRCKLHPAVPFSQGQLMRLLHAVSQTDIDHSWHAHIHILIPQQFVTSQVAAQALIEGDHQ